MNKRIITTLCISCIMFFSVFFINIDGVKAKECTCYYYADLERVRGSNHDGDRQLTHRTFLFAITYDKNKADVTYSCYADDFGLSNLNPNNLKQKCGANDNIINRGNPFNVDSEYIANQQCSQSACNSANLKLWCGKDVVTEGWNDPLSCNEGVLDVKYVTAEQAEDIINADDAHQGSEDSGVIGNIKSIKDWGQHAQQGEYGADDIGTACSDISELGEFLNNLLWIIDIIAIILLIIMTIADFIKAIVGSNPDDTLKTSFKHLITRAVVIVILLLLPIILGWIISIFNEQSGTVQIGENGEPFCNIEN